MPKTEEYGFPHYDFSFLNYDLSSVRNNERARNRIERKINTIQNQNIEDNARSLYLNYNITKKDAYDFFCTSAQAFFKKIFSYESYALAAHSARIVLEYFVNYRCLLWNDTNESKILIKETQLNDKINKIYTNDDPEWSSVKFVQTNGNDNSHPNYTELKQKLNELQFNLAIVLLCYYDEDVRNDTNLANQYQENLLKIEADSGEYTETKRIATIWGFKYICDKVEPRSKKVRKSIVVCTGKEPEKLEREQQVKDFIELDDLGYLAPLSLIREGAEHDYYQIELLPNEEMLCESEILSNIDKKDALIITKKVFKALLYLRDIADKNHKKIYHRSISPWSVLLREQSCEYRIRLSDFNKCKITDTEGTVNIGKDLRDDITLTKFNSHMVFIHPKVRENAKNNSRDRGYTAEESEIIDLYSVFVLLIYILNGKSISESDLETKVLRANFKNMKFSTNFIDHVISFLENNRDGGFHNIQLKKMGIRGVNAAMELLSDEIQSS